LAPTQRPLWQTSLSGVDPSVALPTGPPVPLFPKHVLLVWSHAVPYGQHIPLTMVLGLPGLEAPVPEQTPRPEPPSTESQSESLRQCALLEVSVQLMGVSGVFAVVHATPSLQTVSSGAWPGPR